MARLIARAALCLAIAVPLLMVLWLIATYGHNIPFMEEWITTGDVAIRAASGQFTVADLFGTWKDHRMLLLNAIAAGNAVIFGWNLTLQQIATVMIAAVNFWLLIKLWRLAKLPHWLVYAVPLSLLVFSLHQAETWLWAFQIAWQILNFCFLFALWTILKPNARPLQAVISAALCLLSMLTLSNTVLIFPLLIGALILRGGVRRWEWALWFGCAAVAGALYLGAAGLHSAVRPPLMTGVLQFLIYLSRSFFVPREPFSGAVALIGLLGLIAFAGASITLIARRSIRAAAPWWIMAAYSMATGFGGVLSRWELNIGYAADSRYVTAGIFFWIGLLGCLALCAVTVIRGRALFQTLTVIVTVGLCITLIDGLRDPAWLTWTTRITDDDIACAVNLPELTDTRCVQGLSVFQVYIEREMDDPAVLEAYRQRVRDLRALQLALFGASPQSTGGS